MLRPPAALALLLALALAACGGDDDASSTASPTAGRTETPEASPTPSPSPPELSEQLSYVGATGEIRLVEADGSGDHVFADAACTGSAKAQGSMAWSPDGVGVAYLCPSESGTTHTLVVRGLGGAEIARVEGVNYYRWAPDSSRIAFQAGEFAVRLLDVASGQNRDVNDDAVLIDWAGPDALLLGLSPVPTEFNVDFKAFIVDIGSGQAAAVPRLDNQRMVWVTADGSRAVTITEAWNNGRGMAVYDFAQDLAVTIDGGYIGYPSDFIPNQQLAFSTDGSAAYWANAAEGPTSVWTARLDAPQAERLGDVQSIFVAVSPSGKVAGEFLDGGTVGTLVIADLVGGVRAEVGPSSGPFAWRTLIP